MDYDDRYNRKLTKLIIIIIIKTDLTKNSDKRQYLTTGASQ